MSVDTQRVLIILPSKLVRDGVEASRESSLPVAKLPLVMENPDESLSTLSELVEFVS